MSLKCGIVGLPNVGKSTLFNALTSSNLAVAANYPFCTIEPNSGIVEVPDERLIKIANIAGSSKIVPTYMEFVDIAGLVKGASKGEGLGNQFLAHIREVDAILHVLRCFDDQNISHVHGSINPMYDAEIIEMELIFADLESVQKRFASVSKKFKSGDKTLKSELDLLDAVQNTLIKGQPARVLNSEFGKDIMQKLQLLTTKPILYVCNVSDTDAVNGNRYSDDVKTKTSLQNAQCVIVSSKIEEEISALTEIKDKLEFLYDIGLQETGLSKIIKASYQLLDLRSFFTVGPKEAKAWTFETGTFAPQAAGIIHSDFEKGFIRAEVISFDDYLQYEGEVKAKENGKMRLEGKSYQMQDGDVVHFRFNV